jgi:glycine cleavage system H protein
VDARKQPATPERPKRPPAVPAGALLLQLLAFRHFLPGSNRPWRSNRFNTKFFIASCLYIGNSFPYISQKPAVFSTHRSQAHDQTLPKTKTPMFRRKNAEPNCCKGGRMFFPEELLYNEDHVWVEEEAGQATIGITEYLQDEMEQILSVEMPEIGSEIELGDTLATIELPQGVMEIYSPLSGEVLEINQDLVDSPEWLNSSPYEDGWIICVKMTETEELEDLMDADDYTEFVQG